jgi:SAM-dependent methyltransferase
MTAKPPTAESGEVLLRPVACAICGTFDNAELLHPPSAPVTGLDARTFSARRLPDRKHYRLVRCSTCGLVRSDPAAEPGLLKELYERSSFDYGDQVPSLRRTYRRYLDQLNLHGVRKGRLLEIGCGNGFFLEEALAAGFATVAGVEPSRSAIAQANERVRSEIAPDVMRPGLFRAAEFDVICLFQVLDHLPDPGQVVDECHRVLKPGGLMLCLNHNVEALSARILGSLSPIVDVEHTFLYSPRTIARLLGQHGFTVRRVGRVTNTYGLA